MPRKARSGSSNQPGSCSRRSHGAGWTATARLFATGRQPDRERGTKNPFRSHRRARPPGPTVTRVTATGNPAAGRLVGRGGAHRRGRRGDRQPAGQRPRPRRVHSPRGRIGAAALADHRRRAGAAGSRACPTSTELCFAIRSGGAARAPIIVVTARGAQADRVEALDAGADDYIVKPFGFEELIARMRAVLRRARDRRRRSSRPSARLRVDLSGRRAHVDGEQVSLTGKEFDILACLALEPGRVVSTGGDLRPGLGRALVRPAQGPRCPYRRAASQAR